MTPEPLQNSQQLEDLRSQLAELRSEKNRQISEYKEAWQGFAQRANAAEQRAEHFKAERDALQAMVDGALVALQRKPKLGESTWRVVDRALAEAIKILTGEGES